MEYLFSLPDYPIFLVQIENCVPNTDVEIINDTTKKGKIYADGKYSLLSEHRDPFQPHCDIMFKFKESTGRECVVGVTEDKPIGSTITNCFMFPLTEMCSICGIAKFVCKHTPLQMYYETSSSDAYCKLSAPTHETHEMCE